MAIKLQGPTYKVGSVGLVETQGCFRPETEFSLDPPMPVVVPFFINKKIAITTAERLFQSRGIFKNFAQNQTCLICNKDDMALKVKR